MKTNLLLYVVIMIGIIIMIPLLIVGLVSWEQSPELIQEEDDFIITVYNHLEDKVVDMKFEDYIIGVVTGEMPAEFESEALKAQAAAARTYAYRKLKLADTSAKEHKGAIICTNPAHCQAWTSMEAAVKKWGIFKAGYNAKKVTNAVIATKGVILTYKGEIANPLYHANSGGATENSEDVWEGVVVPYLRSVESKGEEKSKSFKTTVNIAAEEFAEIFQKKYPDAVIDTDNIGQELEILEHTTGGRVKTIRVGSVTLKGTEFRSILSLRSANFTIQADKSGMLSFTTLGYGHGVGMSQWGANNLAQKGAKYDEILRYYYSGVSLTTIDKYEMPADTHQISE